MNKRGALPMGNNMLMAISIIAGMITILASAGYLDVASITGSGSYIERPVFKYVKCEAVSSYSYSTWYTLASNGEWANKPSVSSSYDINFKVDDVAWNDVPYLRHSICNSKIESSDNCRVYQMKTNLGEGDTFEIRGVRNNEVVRLELRNSWNIFNPSDKTIAGGQYQIGYVPYGLREYNILGGSSAQLNPNDCSVSTTSDTYRDRIIATDIDDVKSRISNSVNENVLQPEEVRWYVAGYLTSASPSFMLDYNGRDAWCRPTGSSAEIYQINTIQLGSGTYKVASADWSDYLGKETCCPKQVQGDDVCNDNFQWETIGGSECGVFSSCGSPNWIPYTTNTLIKYSCVNGYCESETKQVECADDFDCSDSNQVCDLNSFTCEDANVNLQGQVIITIPDTQAGCEAVGGKWIKKTEEQTSIWNFFGIGEPKLVVEEYCDTSKPNYFAWIIGIIAVIGIIFFFPRILAGIKVILAKFGVR